MYADCNMSFLFGNWCNVCHSICNVLNNGNGEMANWTTYELYKFMFFIIFIQLNILATKHLRWKLILTNSAPKKSILNSMQNERRQCYVYLVKPCIGHQNSEYWNKLKIQNHNTNAWMCVIHSHRFYFDDLFALYPVLKYTENGRDRIFFCIFLLFYLKFYFSLLLNFEFRIECDPKELETAQEKNNWK